MVRRSRVLAHWCFLLLLLPPIMVIVKVCFIILGESLFYFKLKSRDIIKFFFYYLGRNGACVKKNDETQEKYF